MSLGDIYYIIFRHKWKIILVSLAGIAAAVGFYFFKPPPYQSSAELLIKYVPEAAQPTFADDNQKVIMPDPRGEDIISSEIQILTSMDVAEMAVTNFGASNILARAGSDANPYRAAIIVRNNLVAVPADKGSSVIVVTFKDPNSQIVQPVLQEIINDYFLKHYEIHSAGGQFEDALTMEQSTLSVQLNATEQQLADLKNKANIISIEDSQKDLADQISKIRDDIMDAQAELSGYEAVAKQTDGGHPLDLQGTNSTATNAQQVIPQNQKDAYGDVCASLDGLLKKEQGYLVQGFMESNALLLEVQGQIADAEKTKGDFENKYPQIAGSVPISPAGTGSAAAPIADAQAQIALIASLNAKIKAWSVQMDQLQMRATNLNNLEPTISQLEQTKSIQQANYQNLSVSLEKSHIDGALDTGKTPNIKWVQMPSPPSQDWKKTYKTIAGLAIGGIFAGLAWAFLIEMFLDRSVRRPVEIEAKLKMPLFLSIPDVNRNGHARLLQSTQRRQLQMPKPEGNGSPVPDGAATNGAAPQGPDGGLEMVSREKNPALQLYYEALRDRLIVYFEVKNLTHKPKLVAVTGVNRGAGISTVAAGLAASLSETGEGNVLLVDMNLEHGAAQQFYKGSAGCGLDTALKSETKSDALVQENLYVVNGHSNNNELPHALPKRFAALVPRLKASDYDYIIFDLPLVTPTSITARLARFMDMTLLVVESEKTDREIVQQANHWLTEAGATVGVVLNKTRKYVPDRLHQDFLGNK